MLNEEILVPLFFFLTIIAVSVGVPLARAFARRIDRQRLQPSVTPEVLQRLERMEQAIDSVAVEVERISENQRFTTRLLTDRAQPVEVPSAGERPIIAAQPTSPDGRAP